MATSKTLVLTFGTSDGKTASVSLAHPKDNLLEDEVRNAMTAMCANGVFVTKTGIYNAARKAEVVERTATEVFHA